MELSYFTSDFLIVTLYLYQFTLLDIFKAYLFADILNLRKIVIMQKNKGVLQLLDHEFDHLFYLLKTRFS